MTRPEPETARTSNESPHVSRRKFLTRTSLGLAGATAALQLPLVHTAFGAGDAEVKIGLIGCGGRGTGAVLDAVGAATNVIYPSTGYHTEDAAENAKVETKSIQVVGLADLFEDRLARCRTQLGRIGIDIAPSRCFTGFDAYHKLLAESEINQEHEDLIASIRAGNPINEAQAIAESTMTGILGREAVYSGQAITWDDAMNSTVRLGPEEYEMGPYPIPEVAMPGIYRFS